MFRTLIISLLLALSLFGQQMPSGPIKGKPTNLDVHGRLNNVDGPTSHMGYVVPHAVKPHVTPIKRANILVWTRGYDNNRSGANTDEKYITPANVHTLQKLYTHVLPGDARGMEAVALSVPGVKLDSGETKDLMVYATMANDVYVFDADSPRFLWGVNLGTPIANSTQIDGYFLNDNWGILSTPVYDKDTQLLYVVTWTGTNWQTAEHTIHTLSIANGRHASAPVPLTTASYAPGNGLPVQLFKNSERKQRASLVLATIAGHKTLFVPFGTIQETSANARGWVVALDCGSNTVEATWTATSRYSGGGIWSAGAGPVFNGVDSLFFLTGNGSFDAKTEWGESFIKLQYTPPVGTGHGALKVVDWWSPWSDSARAGGPLNGDHITTDIGEGWDDMDLGSSGVTMIPQSSTNCQLIGGGKDGIGYVLPCNKLGKTQLNDFLAPAANYAKTLWTGWLTYFNPATPTPTNPRDLNVIYAQRTHHQHSTPVWFKDTNGYKLFIAGENGNVRAWSINTAGQLQYIGCSAEYASSGINYAPGGMPGMMLAISSNGTNNGVVFAASPLLDANKVVSSGFIYAYDASKFGKYTDGSGSMPLLWQSPPIIYNKFLPPEVQGGKLFYSEYNGTVSVFGLPQ